MNYDRDSHLETCHISEWDKGKFIYKIQTMQK